MSQYCSILVLHNVSKKKNFGELIRSAAAMGVVEIAVVGASKLATHGAMGCATHMKFVHFHRMSDCAEYLRKSHRAHICGIEITPDSQSITQHPFHGTTAFLVGNEGQGLSESQMSVCDQFVYIPQHSTATASLNVNAACAIILHHFATWAALPEAPRQGFKFECSIPDALVPHSGIGLKQMRTLSADGTAVDLARRKKTNTDGAAEESDDDDFACQQDLFDEQESGNRT